MPNDTTRTLTKTLTLAPAVGLAITMVIGSGLLVLPGLAYHQTGNAAVYAWLVSAVACAPILIILARLGAETPDAGGIAAFVQAAFGRRPGAATEILILGTIPGGAAIAVTGGQYFAALVGNERIAIAAGTAIVLAVGGWVNFLGARVSGRVQQWLAAGLVTLLAGVAIAALVFADPRAGTGIAPMAQWVDGLPAVPLVFFAFVGWELMSFTGEEFANPARDFPLMILASFLIVVVLYALIAVAIQIVLPVDDPRILSAPIAALLSSAAGQLSGRFVAGLGFLMVLANFVGVVWAFSRLSFASAREGLLPQPLSHLHTSAKIPRTAVVAVTIAFTVIAMAYFAGLVTHLMLFELAGVSFFFSYILAALTFTQRMRSRSAKVFGVLTTLFLLVVFVSFGMRVLYPLAVFASGYLACRWQDARRGNEKPAAESRSQ